MPSTHTCETCGHFKLVSDPDGECRRGVPVYSLGTPSLWPECVKTDWCGGHTGLDKAPYGPPVRADVKRNVKGRA